MEKPLKFPKMKNGGTAVYYIMFITAFAATVFAIITGSYISDTEILEVGDIAGRRYVSARDIENTVATNRLREKATEEISFLYKHDPDVEESAMEELELFFSDFNKTLSDMEAEAQKKMEEENGGESEEDLGGYLKFDLEFLLNIPIAVTAEEAESYYILTAAGKEQFKEDVKNAVKFGFEQRITDETIEKVEAQTDAVIDGTLWQESLKDFGKDLCRAVLKPNLVIDEEATEAAKQKKYDEVEPVIVRKNQKIIDEGEVVTEEAFVLLTDLGLINNSYSGSVMPFIGSIGIVLTGFIAIYFYMVTQQKKFLANSKNITVIFTIYMLSVAVIRIMADLNNFYFIPVSLFAMLMALLSKTKTAIILNIFMSISSLFIFNGGADFLVYSLITGSFGAILMQYTNKRSRILIVSGAMGIVHMAVYMAVGLFFYKETGAPLVEKSLWAGVCGIATVIVVVGSMPIWEGIFGVDTKYRLMELANPNNELIKRLMLETPGTYHHCLVVANLAEAAAYDIFCDGELARVGAYYHDIGKLNNPLYFSENQFGENIHDRLDPYISAKMIIKHVSDGIEMAKKNRLPNVIIDIISQHQGTTLVKYFYMKSAKEKNNIETREEDFRYPGPIPQFKESAIVMLADTVEAAVRSTASAGGSPKDIEKIIDTLFKDKLNDGQLNDCRLDLKELETIKKSFMKVFNGMYHERVAYPKEEDIERTRREQKAKEKNDDEGKGSV